MPQLVGFLIWEKGTTTHLFELSGAPNKGRREKLQPRRPAHPECPLKGSLRVGTANPPSPSPTDPLGARQTPSFNEGELVNRHLFWGGSP